MANIAATCSSGVLFGVKDLGGGNVASLAQYNGLRQVDNVHIVPARSKPKGFTSTSGIV